MATPSEGSTEERTETASSYRREEFRRQGRVAVSRELLAVTMMIVGVFTLYGITTIVLKEFSSLALQFFDFKKIASFEKADLLQLQLGVYKNLGTLLGPIFVVLITTSIVVCAAQVGFLVSWEPLTPNWERINPINGFQRIWSGQGAVEAIKAIIKLSIVGFILWFFFKSQTSVIGGYMSRSVPEATSLILSSIGKLVAILLTVFAVIAILDYVYQRYQLERQMRMTRREVKEEFKLREGDPLIKSRIKSIQRRIASRRMMEEVPKADVVVTNPTHLAVALKYDAKNMGAPRVTAKGAGIIAEKIKELARFHRVPIVENKPLARTLFKEIEIGQFIPRELYKAVAEVLAYVYRLRPAAQGAFA